jgi:hypothetical protein
MDEAIMTLLIMIGVGLSLIGVCGLIWCILLALKARKMGLSEADMRQKLQKIVTLNLGALAISAVGLMMVVFGIFLS